MNLLNFIRCSVTAITSRSHRGDPGSTPGFGTLLFTFWTDLQQHTVSTPHPKPDDSNPIPKKRLIYYIFLEIGDGKMRY